MKSFAEARALVGGLKGVMAKLNDNPAHEHKWKVMPKCPFCGHKESAGVFNKGGTDYFKCHFSSCSSGGAVLTEVSYIAMREGLSDSAGAEGGASPAYRRFLELAGCWEEPEEKAESGKRKAETPAKKKTEKPAAPVRPNPVQPPAPADQQVSPTPPPEKPVLPNPVIPPEVLQPATNTSPHSASDAERGEGDKADEDMILKCIEVIRMESRASVSLLQRRLKIGYTRASRIIDELEKRGMVGPTTGAEPRDILKLPDERGYIVIKVDEELHFEKADGKMISASATGPGGTSPRPAPAEPRPDNGGEKKGEIKLPLGMTALRWFMEKLFPTESQMSPYLADNSPVPDPIPSVIARKLKFKPVSLFEKRALTSATCAALALRANPAEANEALLQEAKELFSWEELRASGLWLEASRKLKLGRRPNAQFHGKGQIGKKPERERRGKDDKWVWGFCEPVIIPYFDEAGDLLKLRPHKGGAPAGTISGRPRIYVPRDPKTCADVVEKFFEVIICEGEYKAMAIWQTLGLGALLAEGHQGEKLVDPNRFEPIGVCALPGISYVTNVEMRMDLERWLKEVGARRVIVAFDDEDKSDKPLRQRFDAQRDARVLAVELSQILHVEARVCVLPREWRNAHGKADWDGALVKVTASPPLVENKKQTTKPK